MWISIVSWLSGNVGDVSRPLRARFLPQFRGHCELDFYLNFEGNFRQTQWYNMSLYLLCQNPKIRPFPNVHSQINSTKCCRIKNSRRLVMRSQQLWGQVELQTWIVCDVYGKSMLFELSVYSEQFCWIYIYVFQKRAFPILYSGINSYSSL